MPPGHSVPPMRELPAYSDRIADWIERGWHLGLICRNCKRSVTLDAAALAALSHGPDDVVERIRRRARCRACGAGAPYTSMIDTRPME